MTVVHRLDDTLEPLRAWFERGSTHARVIGIQSAT